MKRREAMTGRDAQLLNAIMAMDKAAKLALLECLQRTERGECSAKEAVEEFGRYATARKSTGGGGSSPNLARKSVDGDEG